MSKLKKAARRSPKENGSSAQGIQSIEIGIALLQTLAANDGPMSLGALALAAGMPASSCRRYLLSLIHANLVHQEERSGRYDLGSGLLKLGLQALSRFDIVGATVDRALLLRDETRQTTVVSVFGERGPTVVGWFDGTPRLIVNSHFGSVYSLLGTATGRVFLAFLPDEATQRLLEAESRDGLEDHGPEAVAKIVASVRRDRHSLIRDEVVPGLGAIAAPVFDAQGAIASVITIIATSTKMADDRAAALAKSVQQACDDVSKAAGFVSGDRDRSLARWLAETWRLPS